MITHDALAHVSFVLSGRSSVW